MVKLDKFTFVFVVEECQKQGDICSNGRCINVPSGFQCVCNQGYILGRDNVCLGKFDLQQEFSRLFLYSRQNSKRRRVEDIDGSSPAVSS